MDPELDPGDVLNRRPQAVLYSLPRLRWQRLKGLAWSSQDWVERKDRKELQKRFPNVRPRYSEELLTILRDLYEPEILALEKFLNRDLSHWRQDPFPDRVGEPK
ncbi:MAG: hypothetical protein AAF191_03355 [Verrucomicrobiota bacterium]